MQWKIKSLLGLGLLCLSQTAFADVESRLSELERQMDQIRVVTPNETCGANTALARPVLDSCNGCCGDNWWLDLAVLFWHPKIGGTEYAYTDLATAYVDHGRIKQIDFNWDWGVKVGIGHNFAHDGWDLGGQYTYYESGASDTVSVSSPTEIVPIQGTGRVDVIGFYTVCSRARTQFNTTFQEANLYLGRSFYVSEWLSLHPYFGLKAALFDLEQDIRYSGGSDIGNNVVHIYRESDFWGVGPGVGVNGNFHLGKGFSLFGDFQTALTYGNFDVDHKEEFSLSIAKKDISYGYHTFVPTIQLQIGFQYDRYFWDDEKHLCIRAGFEAQYWFNANQMLQTFTEVASSSNPDVERFRYFPTYNNVTFHGLTLEGRIDF